MMVREQDDHTLLLAQATPREWLEDGKEISVKNAPTWFGELTYDVQSHASTGSINATVRLDSYHAGTTVVLRLRHPLGKLLRGVAVNGKPWRDFDAQEEWIRIPDVGRETYSIAAAY
jgi:hypothetical protein